MELRVGTAVFENGKGHTKQQIDLVDRAKGNYVTIMRLLLLLANKIRRN
jgi:hypothetical protein